MSFQHEKHCWKMCVCVLQKTLLFCAWISFVLTLRKIAYKHDFFCICIWKMEITCDWKHFGGIFTSIIVRYSWSVWHFFQTDSWINIALIIMCKLWKSMLVAIRVGEKDFCMFFFIFTFLCPLLLLCDFFIISHVTFRCRMN